MNQFDYEYLSDDIFLKEVDFDRTHIQLVKITILDNEERPLQDLVGRATAGSINVDGSSSMRRTANITFILTEDELDLSNLDFIFAMNKRIFLSIGVKNKTNKYPEYPILWFPQGVFLIISPSITHDTKSVTIQLQLKDKMCLLNGDCGGILPASVVFNEIDEFDANGNRIITHPTIYRIITECVNHFGGQQMGKIIISDIDERIKRVVQWNGSIPLYRVDNGYTSIQPSEVIKGQVFQKGDNIGYIYVDFTYQNGDLIGAPGSKITDILDKLKSYCGNFEYFYDVYGYFHFQEIKNYLNVSQSTTILQQLNEDLEEKYLTSPVDRKQFILDQSRGKSVYSFTDSNLITSYKNNPAYNKIKNDWVVWGNKKSQNSSAKNALAVRYHLAIDKKPQIGKLHRVFKFIDPEDGLTKAKATRKFKNKDAFPKQGDRTIYYQDLSTGDIYLWMAGRYTDTWLNSDGSEKLDDKKMPIKITEQAQDVTSKDWRTQLYLQGVQSEVDGTYSNYYYPQLAAEWPRIYNIFDGDFYPQVFARPQDINYWLDFIDDTGYIGRFSVSNIGRRTYSKNENNINCVFQAPVPEQVLIQSGTENTQSLIQEANGKEDASNASNYYLIDSGLYEYITFGTTGLSAYDNVRAQLHQSTSFNETISLTTVPIYHLEPNTRITVNDPTSGIFGDYMIKSYSINFDIKSTMNINANRAIERI